MSTCSLHVSCFCRYSGIRMGAYPLVRKTFSGNAAEADIGLPTKIASGCFTGTAVMCRTCVCAHGLCVSAVMCRTCVCAHGLCVCLCTYIACVCLYMAVRACKRQHIPAEMRASIVTFRCIWQRARKSKTTWPSRFHPKCLEAGGCVVTSVGLVLSGV